MTTIVIGAGLAGLTASLRLAQAGEPVTLLTFGLGGLQLGQGTVDVLGYSDALGPDPIDSPFDAIGPHIEAHPGHPYALFDSSRVQDCVDWFQTLLPDLLLPGDNANHRVPTALGAMRPTYLAQPSMEIPPEAKTLAIVGPRQLKDFYPEFAAENLALSSGLTCVAHHLDCGFPSASVDTTPTMYANHLDTDDDLAQFATAVRALLGNEDAVGLPAVLGHRNHRAWKVLTDRIGKPAFEILLGPPGIPGMRLNEALTDLALVSGVRIVMGSKVTDFAATGNHLDSVTLHQTGRDTPHAADHFVYCPGGFESGALVLDSYGRCTETLFGLPLRGGDNPNLITGDYWADQKLFEVGVDVDPAMRPMNGETPVFDNLHCAGGILAGAVRWSEKSGDGIAIASAVAAADAIIGAGPTPQSPTDYAGQE